MLFNCFTSTSTDGLNSHTAPGVCCQESCPGTSGSQTQGENTLEVTPSDFSLTSARCFGPPGFIKTCMFTAKLLLVRYLNSELLETKQLASCRPRVPTFAYRLVSHSVLVCRLLPSLCLRNDTWLRQQCSLHFKCFSKYFVSFVEVSRIFSD